MKNYFKSFLMLVLILSFAQLQISAAETKINSGILKNAVYPFDDSGFLVNRKLIELKGSERLVENPQLADTNQDGIAELIIYTFDGSDYRVYISAKQEEGYVWPVEAFQVSPVKSNLKSLLPLVVDLAEPKLEFNSLYGRKVIFALAAGQTKTYGEFYHFGKDSAAPSAAIAFVDTVFSPNNDGFLDQIVIPFSMKDENSDYALDTYFQILNEQGQVVYQVGPVPKTYLNTLNSVTWDGRDNQGQIVSDGKYKLQITSQDEFGNQVKLASTEFTIKAHAPVVSQFDWQLFDKSFGATVNAQTLKAVFSLRTSENIVPSDSIQAKILLIKKSNPAYRVNLSFQMKSPAEKFEWNFKDQNGYEIDDGLYTVEASLVDQYGNHSNVVSANLGIDRQPVKVQISKNTGKFTPERIDDMYADNGIFYFDLTENNQKVVWPYDYELVDDFGLVIKTGTQATDMSLSWDGKDQNGQFVPDGLYTLIVRTVDAAENSFEIKNSIVKNRIPLQITEPRGILSAINALPVVGTIAKPFDTLETHFDRFEIFYRAGVSINFQTIGNIPDQLDQNWIAVKPLDPFLDEKNPLFPETLQGVKRTSRSLLGFFMPPQSGAYTLLVRAYDKEGHRAIAFSEVQVSLNIQALPVVQNKNEPDSFQFNLQSGSAFQFLWDTTGLPQSFNYEMSVFSLNNGKKTALTFNRLERGLDKNLLTAIAWNGQNGFGYPADLGNYEINFKFFDDSQHYLVTRSVTLEVLKAPLPPIEIKKVISLGKKIIFNTSRSVFYHFEIQGESTFNVIEGISKSGDNSIDLSFLPDGSYQINLLASDLNNPKDQAMASLAAILDSQLTQSAAQLILLNSNINPQHYFGIRASHEGIYYPAQTANVVVRVSGIATAYPYDPYQILADYEAHENYNVFHPQRFKNQQSTNGDRRAWTYYFEYDFVQDILLDAMRIGYADVRLDGQPYPTPGKYPLRGVGEGSHSLFVSTEWPNHWAFWESTTSWGEIFYQTKTNHNHHQQIEYFSHPAMANQYSGALPPFAEFKKQLLASMDRFYLLRKTEKTISLNFVSERPDYEKSIEKTFYYGAVTKDKFDKAGLNVNELLSAGVIEAAGKGYLFKLDIPNDQWGWYYTWYYTQYPQYAKFAYQNMGSFNVPPGPAYYCYAYKPGYLREAIDRLANYSRTVHLLPEVVLKHDTPPTEFHEFNLMQQVQFDDQEFVEVLLVSSNKTFDDSKNYLNAQLTVKNIAEPKQIPFDILLSVPVSAFKGGDFRSGDLTARVKDTFFGDNKQTIQIPYVLDNKLQYLSFEIPVSMDVQISGFELKDDGSNADLQIRATYEQGVPEVVGTTQAEKPWSSLQDPNLKDGQILGIQKYDPVLNSQMNLAQFYPKASLNHSQAMFHRQKGQLVLNPQVKLTGPFSVALFDLENQSPHQVLQVSNLLTESDPLKDSIQVQLNAGKTLKANLPLFGFIQSNYVQNGFEISGRQGGSVTWNHLLSAAVVPDAFQRPGTMGDYLGIVSIDGLNGDYQLQLTSSGISGNAGSVVTVKMGKQINNQMLSRVYSPDYLNWVDIKAGALNDRSQEWVTFFTEKNNQRSVTLPAYLVEPVDSIYRLKPYGLSFNQNQKPVMQNLMFNDTLENIELLTLKSYQLAGSLTESEATIQNDLNEDDLLMPAETVLISTTLNAFANHFYTAGLNKIKPETFFIYSATSSIGLKALGSPTKNAEVFLGDQINSVRLTLNADINGVYDYQDYLPEGQYLIRFREYQLENSFKQTGPLSNVVFVRVDLTDPVLSQVKLDRTVFSDVYAGGQLSFYASELSTLKIILNGTQTISVNYTAVAGLNRIAFKVPTLNEGVYELTYQLTDPVNRISNTVTGSIQIDRTAPTQVKIVSPLSGSSAFAYTTLEYSAPQDGSGSGIQSLGLYQTFSGGDQLIANLNPTSPTAAVYLTADVSGSAQIKIKAVDFGGNITWSDVQLVTVLADSLTQISDQKLIPEFQDYVIKNLSSESGFGIPGMDVYVLTDLSQTAQINNMTPIATLDAQGQLPVVSISVTPDVFYILAVTQNHFSNLVTVPNRLPHFEAPLIAGKMPAVSQVSMGQTLYEKNNVSVSAGDWVNKADVLKLSFVPVRSQRKYLAQTATIDSQLMLSLTATSSQMLIYQAQPNQVYYKKLNGDQVHFDLYLSGVPTMTVLQSGFQNLPAEQFILMPTQSFEIKMANQDTQLKFSFLNGLEQVFNFNEDLSNSAVTALSAQKQVSGNLMNLIVTWQDAQSDIAEYQINLMLITGNTKTLINSAVTQNKNYGFAGLDPFVLYEISLRSRDYLNNFSATRSYAVNYTTLSNTQPVSYQTPQGVTLMVPPGAVLNGSSLTTTALNPALVTGEIRIIKGIESHLLPAQTLQYPIDINFKQQPVEIAGIDLEDLAIYVYDSAAQKWSPVSTGDVLIQNSGLDITYRASEFQNVALVEILPKQYMISGLATNNIYTTRTQALNIYAVKNNGQKVLRPRSFSVSGNLTMSASALTTNPQGDAQLKVTLNATRGQSYFIVVNDAQGVSGSVQFIDQSIPLIVDSVRVSNSYEVVLVTGNQINLEEGLTYQLQWFVKEAQGVSISYSFNGYSAFQPSGNGSVMVSPSYQDAGTKNILLSLSDGVTVTTYNYIVVVKNVNQIARLALNYLEITENQIVTGSIALTDGDNDILQVVVSPNVKPFEFSFSGNQLFYLFNPNLKSAGLKFFEIKIDDGQGTSYQYFTLKINNLNHLPQLVSTPAVQTIYENQKLSFEFVLNDLDDDELTATANLKSVLRQQKVSGNTVFNFDYTADSAGGLIPARFIFNDGNGGVITVTQDLTIIKDTMAPSAVWQPQPDNNTFSVQYPLSLAVSDNVWQNLDAQVLQNGVKIFDGVVTHSVNVAPTLSAGLNTFEFKITDGAGNQTVVTHALNQQNLSYFDPILKIFVEIPAGATTAGSAVTTSVQNTITLVSANWSMGQLPYAIAKLNDATQKITLTTTADYVALLKPAQVAMVVKKVTGNAKINPVLWNPLTQQWEAHTAQRITAAEFTSTNFNPVLMNLSADEEIIYFETTALGQFNLMTFTTDEKPGVMLVQQETFYQVGENEILFALKGNYLRPERTIASLNGVTINIDLAAMYQTKNKMFTVKSDQFVSGKNIFKVTVENLVNTNTESFELISDATELLVKNNYPYPNPARVKANPLLSFSYVLSREADVNIKVYNLNGQMIKELSAGKGQPGGKVGFNAVPWDGVDQFGNEVANGLYLYVLTVNDGQNKIVQKKKVGILL